MFSHKSKIFVGNSLKYLPTRKLCIIALPVIIALSFSSCRKTTYQTDISGTEMEFGIGRFERDLFGLDFDSIQDSVPFLYERYGEFFDLFNYRIINIGGARQPTYPDYLKSFLTDYLNHQVYGETMKVFPDLSELEAELSDAFKRYTVHFPGMVVPVVYTFISRFNQSIVTAEGILAIGLDNYLGTECEFYSRLGKHRYQVLNMHPGKIASDCMMGWGMTEFEYRDSVDNVLSNMIYHGKMAYFTKWMLPGEPDSLIMGFSAGQMRFCRNNEARMWEYLVENKLLFETDRMTILKFTGEGPFTRDFTHESPARAAVWLGWRIVEDYMRRSPEVSLPELMAENNYQKILTLSKYNP
jgi:hypothetical protein